MILLDGELLKDRLPELAEVIVDKITDQDPEHSQELLSTFVSQLLADHAQGAQGPSG